MTALRTLIEDVRVLGERQRTLLLLVQQAAWTSCSFGFLCSKPHRGSAALLSATLSVYLSCITDEEPQVWEPQSFIMGCKKTFLLLQKEILFLSSKAICYLNIFEKTVQNKAASASPQKICRNSETHDICLLSHVLRNVPKVTQIVSGLTPRWPWENFSMLSWFKYYRDNAFFDPLI